MAETTPEMSGCPDAARLAAFVDGVLTGAERDAVVEHLAGCDLCTEVVAETVRDGVAFDQAGADVVPVRRWWRRPVLWIGAAAAAALVAAVLAPRFHQPGPGPSITVATLVDALCEQPDSSAWEPWYPDAQALSFSGGDHRRTAFMAGVRLADLEAASRAGDRRRLIQATTALLPMLEAAPIDQGTAAELRRWPAALEQGETIRAGDTVRDAERQLGSCLGTDLVGLGAWAETARIAAMSGAASFFEDTLFANRLHAARAALVDERSAALLDEIEGLAAVEDPARLPALAAAFEQLILVQ